MIVDPSGKPASSKKVILCTIPHTGTWFFEKLLKDHGVNVSTQHCTYNGEPGIRKAVEDGAILVTTYRDFQNVTNSWVKRGRVMATLSEHLECWYRLFEFEPIIVSVDNNREMRLELLSAVLDVDLQTDWTPVNVTEVN